MDQEKTTMSNGWRREEWRDNRTNELVAIEVIPENDLQPHISSSDCQCIPIICYPGYIRMTVHNSFDGRENDAERGN